MKIYVVYGTVEGQTKKISDHMAARLTAAGHQVTAVDAAAKPAQTGDVTEADAVVVAACVHQKVHREAVVDFALAHKDKLNAVPSAFVSVSLAAALPDGDAEAQGYIDTFVSETGWTPGHTLPIAGALRYNEYDFFKQQIVKFMVMQSGLNVASGQDHEFTDWAKVDAFVDAFAASA